MEIYINNAILHIMNNKTKEFIFSDEELDIDSDMVYEFLEKHIKRLFRDPGAKKAVFNHDSPILGIFNEFKERKMNFGALSRQIGQKLVDIMVNAPDIPDGALIFTQFNYQSASYLAIMKLNHREYYTHEIINSANHIIKSPDALPFDSGRLEEAALIPFDPMVLNILERSYPINGDYINYFSEIFLECSPEMSKKEIAKIIKEISRDIVEKYDDSLLQAKINIALIEESIEQDGEVRLEAVAKNAFEITAPEVKDDFSEMLKDYELTGDINLDEKFCATQFGHFKFKATNGIEVKIPVGLTDDTEIVEFIRNADNSLNVVLKGLRRS
ncbi:MAG: nucleoid-associated protein [Defluviitaleaceae bacterium]|nr:nucleoid-associated protein [Defluviitaleaceae bacterium]